MNVVLSRNARCLYETVKAIRVEVNHREVWLPKSQLTRWPGVEASGPLVGAAWLASKLGISIAGVNDFDEETYGGPLPFDPEFYSP